MKPLRAATKTRSRRHPQIRVLHYGRSDDGSRFPIRHQSPLVQHHDPIRQLAHYIHLDEAEVAVWATARFGPVRLRRFSVNYYQLIVGTGFEIYRRVDG